MIINKESKKEWKWIVLKASYYNRTGWAMVNKPEQLAKAMKLKREPLLKERTRNTM